VARGDADQAGSGLNSRSTSREGETSNLVAAAVCERQSLPTAITFGFFDPQRVECASEPSRLFERLKAFTSVIGLSDP
jgi:hypothetical protein